MELQKSMVSVASSNVKLLRICCFGASAFALGDSSAKRKKEMRSIRTRILLYK